MLYKFDKRNLFVFSMMFLLILLLRKRKFLTFTYKLYEAYMYIFESKLFKFLFFIYLQSLFLH